MHEVEQAPPEDGSIKPDAIFDAGDKDHGVVDSRLHDAITDVFDRFDAHAEAPDDKKAAELTGLTRELRLHGVHPELGIPIELNLVRADGDKVKALKEQLDGKTVNSGGDGFRLATISIGVPVEHEDRLALPAAEGHNAIDQIGSGSSTDLVGQSVVAASLDEQVDVFESRPPLSAAHVLQVDLGVLGSLSDSEDYGLDTSGFEEEVGADVIEEYSKAIQNHDFARTQEIDARYIAWQIENNKLIPIDGNISPSTSSSIEEDRAIEGARALLDRIVTRVEEASGHPLDVSIEDLLRTSGEKPAPREAFWNDGFYFMHQDSGRALTNELLVMLQESGLEPIAPPAQQLPESPGKDVTTQ